MRCKHAFLNVRNVPALFAEAKLLSCRAASRVCSQTAPNNFGQWLQSHELLHEGLQEILLHGRVACSSRLVSGEPLTRRCPVACFNCSTGAAADACVCFNYRLSRWVSSTAFGEGAS